MASLASIVCLTVGIFGPRGMAFLLPLTGLFLSIVFPTTTAAMSDLHRESVGTILGLLFTFGGLGGMLGPWLIGLASDLLGIQMSFDIVIVFCLLMMGALAMLMATREHEKARMAG